MWLSIGKSFILCIRVTSGDRERVAILGKKLGVLEESAEGETVAKSRFNQCIEVTVAIDLSIMELLI
ncbi:hypothetical protein L6452_05521 [Arctium lappa]|uniref:Uncharacterized protein n=1 Tax=Arctium lappa TaxID=4217 RepID=A0ACB9EGX8_ARCLA|nr:hypothetical protein L6452_05521 [Arctium lappa]